MSSKSEARWGWHQLDSRWAERIVAEATVGPGDLVLDVGAGTGAITSSLVKSGARVVAVELHPKRAASLRKRFDRDPVKVVVADAADLWLPRYPFKVVANPPFAVSAAVLGRLVAPGSPLIRADLVVPWHVARRWASGHGPGASRWLRQFEVGVGLSIPRSAFRPPPPNGVALLVIRRRGWHSDSRGGAKAVGPTLPGAGRRPGPRRR
ncbi:MAG TPA: rRNA adenine N(6)-methyltransferase family protein [Acidimicrobiales bacterium]|nr:rRNA adenine N(6)-methyltransferase family protein [Acidimicrobiales bacterium]